MRRNGSRRSRDIDPLDALRADFSALRRDFAALTSNGVHKAVDKANGSIEDVASSMKDMGDDARDQLLVAHKRLAEMAADRPVTTIAVAVAAGALGAKIMQWIDRD